jgi:ferredoxin
VSVAGHRGRMIWLRRAVQLACLVLLLWLFRRSTTPAGTDYAALSGVEWWFRIDPLAQATAVLAGRAWTWLLWPSLICIALALFAGRAFCGWICPLGTLLDLWGRCTGWFRRLVWRGRAAPAWARQMRFAVLLAVLLAALGGLQLIGLVDPFSLLVRGLAAADPLLRNAADAASGAVLGTTAEPLSEAAYQAMLPWMSTRTGVPALWWVSLGVLAGVFLLELAGRRGWCRWGCPLGALYGLVGRWAPLLRLPGKVCANCGTCRTSCDLGAFAADGHLRRVDCTLCLRCVQACSTSIARIGVAPQPAVPTRPDPGRRRLLIAGATLAAAPLAAAVAPLRPFGRRDPPADLLRPPGVVADEAGFLQHCIRCGACLAACPEGALHSDGFSVGLPGLLAPALVPRRGACAPDCTRCGEVCPTGAIPRLDVMAKARQPIGIAVVDEQRCIPFISEESCLVCEEHCPVADKAIRLEPGPHGYEVPRVRREPCTGCGWCELVCPLEGRSAIRVVRR